MNLVAVVEMIWPWTAIFLSGAFLGVKVGARKKKFVLSSSERPSNVNVKSVTIRPSSSQDWDPTDEDEDTHVEFPKQIKTLVFDLKCDYTNDDCPVTVKSPNNVPSSGVKSTLLRGKESSPGEIFSVSDFELSKTGTE